MKDLAAQLGIWLENNRPDGTILITTAGAKLMINSEVERFDLQASVAPAPLTMKQARQNKKMSITTVSKYLGVGKGTLYNWEEGKNLPPVDRFADLLDLYGLRWGEMKW